MDNCTLGRKAYDAYCRALQGKNWRINRDSAVGEFSVTGPIPGGRLPDWHELPVLVQMGWEEAAVAAVAHVLRTHPDR